MENLWRESGKDETGKFYQSIEIPLAAIDFFPSQLQKRKKPKTASKSPEGHADGDAALADDELGIDDEEEEDSECGGGAKYDGGLAHALLSVLLALLQRRASLTSSRVTSPKNLQNRLGPMTWGHLGDEVIKRFFVPL